MSEVIQNPASDQLEPIHTCKSCGNRFQGTFCNRCGEKVLEPKDPAEVIMANFASAQRFFRSLMLIITRPGFLSKEYVNGRRVNYTKPLQVFFVLNLVYFLFPLVQLFNTSLNTQMRLRTHSPLVRKMVEEKLRAENLSYQAYNLMYNEKSTGMAKMLIIVFILFAALPTSFIYWKKNRKFNDHLTLSVELAAFNLVMNAILLQLFVFVVNKVLHWTNSGWQQYLNDYTLTIIFILTNLYFLFAAGRTFYNQKGYQLIIKAFLGLFGLFIALELYRLMLFLVTFWSL